MCLTAAAVLCCWVHKLYSLVVSYIAWHAGETINAIKARDSTRQFCSEPPTLFPKGGWRSGDGGLTRGCYMMRGKVMSGAHVHSRGELVV